MAAGCYPNAMNSWNINAITVGVLKGHFGWVKKILDFPSIDVNCKDDNGRTLLITSLNSISDSTYDFLKLLLEEKGADPNIADLAGWTPFHHMCKLSADHITANMGYNKKKGKTGFMEKKTKAYKKIYEKSKKLYFSIIRLLIDNGADVNKVTNNGESGLMIAFTLSMPDVNLVCAKFLINEVKGIDLTIKSKSGKSV